MSQVVEEGWEPVFYEVAGEWVHHYERAGFSVFKIGEEARLRADEFHLKGRDLSEPAHGL